MLDIIIIFSSFFAIILSIYLYRHAAGESILRLNMLTYSFYLLAVLSLFVSIVVVLHFPFIDYDSVMFNHSYGDYSVRLAVWGIVMWMFIGIPLGAMIANKLINKSSIDSLMVNYRKFVPQIGFGFNEKTLASALFLIGTILIFTLFWNLPEDTALSTIIQSHDVISSQIARGATNNEQFGRFYGSIFNLGTLQWLSYIAFGMIIMTGKIKWYCLFGVMFLIVCFFCLVNGEIAPILYYLVGIGFLRNLLGRSFLRFYEGLGIIVLLLGLFILFKGADGGMVLILQQITERLLFSQLIGMYQAFQIFPVQHEFIGFASTGKVIHEILGLPALDSYGLLMMRIYNPEGVKLGLAGHLTTIFMGEAWANFGMFGVIFAPLWVGAVVQLVNCMFVGRHKRKNIISMALYVYLAVTFGYASDFISFYYPVGMLLFLLGVMIIVKFGQFLFAQSSAKYQRMM